MNSEPTSEPVIYREIQHGSSEYRATVTLRDRILRAPLGLAFSDAELAAESTEWHLAAFDSGTGPLIACLVLTPMSETTAKMRQVAVAENHRGRGIGRGLVRFSESFARDRGITELVLNARATVVAFYERLNYMVEGEPFIEVTLPHRRMTKEIAAQKQMKLPAQKDRELI